MSVFNTEYRHLYRQVYDLWSEFHGLNDAKYEEHYRADFKAFELKNVDYAKGLWIGSEEDYNFYSDWSKDMYGYRKRWRVASQLSEQDSVLKGCMATETPYFYGRKDNL